MMNKVSIWPRTRIAVPAVVVLFFALVSRGFGAWAGDEGDEWLKWDAKTRVAYVRAYVKGMSLGFAKGCDAGLYSIEPTKEQGAGFVEKYLTNCESRNPISSRDSSPFVDSITEFYQHYPKQRFLYISDILLKLHAGQTITQIHDEFP
jgi:hypothetical protein